MSVTPADNIFDSDDSGDDFDDYNFDVEPDDSDDPDEFVDYSRRRADEFAAFVALETAHTGRALRFERLSLGGVPAQAFGEVDGQFFYFRFRYDCASLSVGPNDEMLEDAVWLRAEQQRLERIAAFTVDTPEFAHILLESSTDRNIPGGGFYPSRTTAFADIEGVSGDPLLGFLSGEAFKNVFTRLLNDLQDVPEVKQVPKFTQEWLAAGGLWPLSR